MVPPLTLAVNFCGLVNDCVIQASSSGYIFMHIFINVLGSRSVHLLSIDFSHLAKVFWLESVAVVIGLYFGFLSVANIHVDTDC